MIETGNAKVSNIVGKCKCNQHCGGIEPWHEQPCLMQHDVPPTSTIVSILF
jgi:hypothetical protein